MEYSELKQGKDFISASCAGAALHMLNRLHTVKFSLRTVVMVLLGYTALTCD